MVGVKVIVFLLISYSSFSQVSRNFNKKEKPLYEVGVGFISLNTPNYPGAAANTPRFIPFPWFIYRGELLRADEEGTRARFFDSDIIEVGMSGGFNFPIDSDSNSQREGMPDKDTLFGIGPSILIRFLKNQPQHKLTIGLGIRLNLAVGNNLETKDEGWLVEPTIRYWRKFSEDSDLTFFSGLSLSFADRKYNRFFYQVDKDYISTTRDQYDAKSGLVDIAGSFGFAFDITKKASLFAGAFQSNLTSAANKNSPLVENQVNTGFIFGFSWLFYESDTRVF